MRFSGDGKLQEPKLVSVDGGNSRAARLGTAAAGEGKRRQGALTGRSDTCTSTRSSDGTATQDETARERWYCCSYALKMEA